MADGDRTRSVLQRIRSRIAEPVAQALSDTQLLLFVNEGQKDLCLQLNDAALATLSESVTAPLSLDSEPYDLPADFLRERLLVYKLAPARRLAAKDLAALDNNVYWRPTEAKPAYHLWRQLNIEAGVKTAGTYTLHYFRLPADASTSVDPETPQEADDLLVSFATSRCREALGDFAESERVWSEYMMRCSIFNGRAGR